MSEKDKNNKENFGINLLDICLATTTLIGSIVTAIGTLEIITKGDFLGAYDLAPGICVSGLTTMVTSILAISLSNDKKKLVAENKRLKAKKGPGF